MTCLKQDIKAVKLTSVMRAFPDDADVSRQACHFPDVQKEFTVPFRTVPPRMGQGSVAEFLNSATCYCSISIGSSVTRHTSGNARMTEVILTVFISCLMQVNYCNLS